MHVSIFISWAFVASTLGAIIKRQDLDDDPIFALCYPGLEEASESGDGTTVDWTAPCNAIENITYTCIYGASYQLFGSGDDAVEFSNTTQRDCICSSQFWNVYQGCADCFSAHGSQLDSGDTASGIDLSTPAGRASASSAYCAASSTPTAEFVNWLEGSDDQHPDAATSASVSDPLSGSTAVSLYFTAAVTGTSVVYVPEASITPASSGATFSQSILTNAAGVIVPSVSSATSTTMSTSMETTGTSSAAAQTATSSTTSSHPNAVATWAAQPVLGVIALAGAAIFL